MAKRDYTKDTEFERLMVLLQYVLSGKTIDTSLFEGMTFRQWKQLFALAAQQGVVCIAWEAVTTLSDELLPPREVKLQWAISCENIQQRYAKQMRAGEELSSLLAEQGMRMMIFKGPALSLYYPTPSHREFGDLDIYCFGDYARVNSLVEALGISVNYSNEKHATFTFKGVMIENHRTVTDTKNRYENTVEYALMKYTDTAASHDGYYIPSPEFGLLFVMRHSARHFASDSITIRHLIDWCFLLEAEKDKADMTRVMDVVRSSGHECFWNTYTKASGMVCGADLSDFITCRVPEHDLSLMLNSILTDNEKRYNGAGKSRLGRILNLMASRKRYRIVPDKFLTHRLWRSVVSHAHNPETI